MGRAGQDLYREVSVIMRRAELLRRIRAARRQDTGRMLNLMRSKFLIAEWARGDLALLRWALVLVLLWSGEPPRVCRRPWVVSYAAISMMSAEA